MSKTPIDEIAAVAVWTAESSTGKIRAKANRVLKWLGMPIVPLGATQDEAYQILRKAKPRDPSATRTTDRDGKA